ncbi:MAG: amidophosphoribosyltransferase [Clostridia bacterium]|nr:amidophosphoribosyltransferase [Clostridia bacterium]
MSKLHEDCGVFGVFATETRDVASTTYYGLYALQHRGQESCGIVVNDDGVLHDHRDDGLVDDVFTKDVLHRLGEGDMALGHVRYGTADTKGRVNAQPMVVNHIKGRMAVAYNGCLINSFELRSDLEMQGAIFHMNSDVEVISYIITRERLSAPSIEVAVEQAMNYIKGAYSLVVMSPTKLIAARDPNGFHPLCYGQNEAGDYIVASESCALDAVGATLIRELEPGEILVLSRKNGIQSITTHCKKCDPSLCVFEYIYFARPDSVIEGSSVHEARAKAGEYLAKEHPVEADIVVGVPDSGLDAAIGYSRESGIPYAIGFLKNKYIGRTFIAPGQSTREDKVRIKLNPISSVVKDKRVVLVDDSIVRGTTCERIVKLLREAGAKEVHMRVSAPPFLYPCYYGTDIDSQDKLIACKHTVEEIEAIIGVDSLGYLELEDAKKIAVGRKCDGFCCACFDGKYPTDVPTKIYKNRFEQKLSEKGETKK